MKTNRTRWLWACALIAYAAILIRLVVFKAIPVLHIGHIRLKFGGPHTGSANLVPFKTIAPQLMGQGNPLIDMINLIGNILPFMPIGFLVPIVFQSTSWRWALVLGIATGVSFELMEVVFRVGIFDVDDVTLNALGVTLGYGAFALFNRRGQPA